VIFRRILCLLVLICICAAFVSLFPVGAGPFSLVYGPQTAFRAYRASLQLMQSVTAIVIFATACLLTPFDSDDSRTYAEHKLALADRSSSNIPLRR
jgi:hypothetical protein